MKRYLPIMLIGLVACQSTATVRTVEATTSTAAPTTTVEHMTTIAAMSDDDLFYATMDTRGISHGDAKTLAKTTCDALRSGLSWDAVTTFVAQYLAANGGTTSMADSVGFVMGAGVVVFCPEFEDDIG